MATTATAQYWVRKSGSDSNGGGFDAGISGAGTNYANQDAAQVALTGLTCAQNGVTLTQTGATFTSAHVGNAIQITGGTNFLKNLYWITGYTNSNTVTLDRAPCTAGAGSAGTGNLGGGLASLACLSTGGAGLASNPLSNTAQLVPGNIINIQGGGTNDPALASFDYDWSAGYWSFPTGDTTNGNILIQGFNGRPCIKTSGLNFYTANLWSFANLKFFPAPGASFLTYGCPSATATGGVGFVIDCIFDQNGVDCVMFGGASFVLNCEFRNTGSASAGTKAAVAFTGFACVLSGCTIHGIRGIGVDIGPSSMATLNDNIIYGCISHGINFSGSTYGWFCSNNTIDGCGGDGMHIPSAWIQTTQNLVCQNNIISNNTGFAINMASATNQAAIDKITQQRIVDYNNMYNNNGGGAQYNNISAGTHDLSLDPQYVNRAGGNFAIGTNLKAKGTPGQFPYSSSTTAYMDLGAVQRQEAGGGGSTGILVHPGMTGGMRG